MVRPHFSANTARAWQPKPSGSGDTKGRRGGQREPLCCQRGGRTHKKLDSIEKKIIELVRKVVMMHNIGLRHTNGIVLRNSPAKAPHEYACRSYPMSAAHAEIGEAESQKIVYVAAFDDDGAVHVRFADAQIGIQENPRDDGRIENTDDDRWRTNPRRLSGPSIINSPLRIIFRNKPCNKSIRPLIPRLAHSEVAPI